MVTSDQSFPSTTSINFHHDPALVLAVCSLIALGFLSFDLLLVLCGTLRLLSSSILLVAFVLYEWSVGRNEHDYVRLTCSLSLRRLHLSSTTATVFEVFCFLSDAAHLPVELALRDALAEQLRDTIEIELGLHL